METRDKVFWVALGGSVLAGFAFLDDAVHEVSADQGGAGAGAGEAEGQGSAPGAAVEIAGPEVIPTPAPELLPTYEQVDERTALARVIRSEAGSHTPEERVAVAWVVRNRAKKRRVSIRRMVCWPRCGKQGSERPFSSRQAPRPEDLALADAVLGAAPESDPTRGAWDAFEPALQDKLVVAKHPGYTKTAAEVRKDWLRGSDFYGRVGRWELFGPKRTVPPPADKRPVHTSNPPTPRPAVAAAPTTQTKPREPKYGPHNTI